MNPVEQDHDKKHEGSIKDVQIRLMPQQVSVEALQVFDSPEDRSHHDQHAADVQHLHVFLPGNHMRAACRGLSHRSVKGHSDDDENAKAYELDKEPDNDDLGTVVQGR